MKLFAGFSILALVVGAAVVLGNAGRQAEQALHPIAQRTDEPGLAQSPLEKAQAVSPNVMSAALLTQARAAYLAAGGDLSLSALARELQAAEPAAAISVGRPRPGAIVLRGTGRRVAFCSQQAGGWRCLGADLASGARSEGVSATLAAAARRALAGL
jgi:hypothetical protein